MYRESISMIEMSLSLQTHYPVNYLRNIALNNARTQFVFDQAILGEARKLLSYGLQNLRQRRAFNALQHRCVRGSCSDAGDAEKLNLE